MSLKPTLRRTGSYHATIRVAFHPDRETLVNTVAAKLWDEATDYGADPDAKTNRKAIEEALREGYSHHGMDWAMTSGDDVSTLEDPDAGLEWAEGEVTRLFPDWPGPMSDWAIIGCDKFGVTVEATGQPDVIADRVASWAQQEDDRWPEMGLIYMLISPEEIPAARELEASTAQPENP